MRSEHGLDHAALDRWITGNYGEDQFPDDGDYDEEYDVPYDTLEERDFDYGYFEEYLYDDNAIVIP